MLYSVLAISIGASFGAVSRWLLGLGFNALFPTIPPGTVLANLLGGYLIGIAVSFFAANPHLPPEWRLLVITGFLATKLGNITGYNVISTLEILSLALNPGLFLDLIHIGAI